MNDAGMFWLPVLTLWQREMLRFWREKARVLGFVGSPLIFWLLIGSGFGNLDFYFPGALTLTVMFSAVFSTMSLIEDRREGFLLSMLVSPAPRSSMVLGKVLGSATLGWVQGLMFLCFLPLTGLEPGAGGVLALVGLTFLVSFLFTALGFLVAWPMQSTQAFHGVVNLVLLPLWLMSGALFPMETAHGWVQWLMRANPLMYALALLRAVLGAAPQPGTPSLAASLAVTLVAAAVLFAASTFVASRKTNRSFA